MSSAVPAAAPGVGARDARAFTRRQEQILDVIEHVFLREGMHNVRIGDLAAEAQCSRSTLYEIAPTKEELLLLTLDRMMRRITRRGAEAIRHESDPADRVRAMLTSGALDFAPLGTAFMEAIHEYPPARWLFDRHIGAARSVLERLIEEMSASGRFRQVNARVVADGLFVLVMRFTDPDFVRTTGVETSEALAQLFTILVDGLRTPAV